MTKKKLLYSIIFQVILYLLIYFFIPMFVTRFGLHGDPFGGIAKFFEMIIVNIVLITILSVVFYYRFTDEIKYSFLCIPVYIVMHIVMFSIDFRYAPLIGFGNFDVDVFFLITLISQLVICMIVRLIKTKKNANG